MADENTQNQNPTGATESFDLKTETLTADTSSSIPTPTIEPTLEPEPLQNVTQEPTTENQPHIMSPQEIAPISESAQPEAPVENFQDPNKQTTYPDKTTHTKLFIAIGLSIIAVLVIAYAGYRFFFSNSSDIDSNENSDPIESTNTLGTSNEADSVPPSEKMDELNDVVNTLENIYAPATDGAKVYEDAVIENLGATDDSFPSLKLPIKDSTKNSKENSTEDATEPPTEDSSGKLLR